MTAIAPSVTPAAAEPRAAAALPARALAVLVDNRARFLAFLEKRVGGRDAAEEILQQAYLRGMDRGGGLRGGESAVAWFYRLLRNVLADHWRHGDAERRALAAYAGDAVSTVADDGALMAAVCGCVSGLVGTLKPELAEIIRNVDLEGVPLRAYAARAGISANNGAVRLHRARQALGRQIRRTCAAGSIAALRDCDCDCAQAVDGALMAAVCGCVSGLVGTLKPELAEIIRNVDLEGVPLRAYAARAGISANNGAVRLHRARQALGRQIRRTCAAGRIAALRDCDCDCAQAVDGDKR